MSVFTSSAVWCGSKHDGTELLMLLAIADMADDDGHAFPSVGTLAKKCRMKPRNANYILKALQESGELQVRVGKGPYGTNLYRINVKTLQQAAGVQRSAGVGAMACIPPATECANPLQHIAPKTSVKRQLDKGVLPSPPDWVPEGSWTAFVEMRKEIKKPLTPRSMAMIVNRLASFKDQGLDIAEALDQSTRSSWRDIYPPKDSKPKPAEASAWEGAR